MMIEADMNGLPTKVIVAVAIFVRRHRWPLSRGMPRPNGCWRVDAELGRLLDEPGAR